jgi:CO/xanthine dehydrogenase Mo-binding subunit
MAAHAPLPPKAIGGRLDNLARAIVLQMNEAEIEVHVIDRPGEPFLGTGEAGQGPAAAALANAIADAIGHRLRDMPLTAERIRAALRS